MIALARIDERLVHGQVLVGWVPHLGARRVVVADDEAARSPLARAAMTLALPPGVEASVEPAGRGRLGRRWGAPPTRCWSCSATSPRPSGRSPPGSPRRGSPVLNVGNVHYAQGRRQVTPSVFLSGAEVDGLRRLAAAGFRVEVRAVPLDAPIDLAEIERRWNAAG